MGRASGLGRTFGRQPSSVCTGQLPRRNGSWSPGPRPIAASRCTSRTKEARDDRPHHVDVDDHPGSGEGGLEGAHDAGGDQASCALAERDGTTELTISERNLPSEETRALSEQTWKMVLENLKALLETEGHTGMA